MKLSRIAFRTAVAVPGYNESFVDTSLGVVDADYNSGMIEITIKRDGRKFLVPIENVVSMIPYEQTNTPKIQAK